LETAKYQNVMLGNYMYRTETQ